MILENVACFDRHKSNAECYDEIDVGTKVWISIMDDDRIAVDALNCKPGRIDEFRRRTYVDAEVIYSDLQFYGEDAIDVVFARITKIRDEPIEKEENTMGNDRFVKIADGKALDTRNDVEMDFDDCVAMLNVAENIITGAVMAAMMDKMLNDLMRD